MSIYISATIRARVTIFTHNMSAYVLQIKHIFEQDHAYFRPRKLVKMQKKAKFYS